MTLRARRRLIQALLALAVVATLTALALVVRGAQGLASGGLHAFGVLMLAALVVAPLIGALRTTAAQQARLGPEARPPLAFRLTSGRAAVLIFLAGAAAMILTPMLLARG